MSSNLALLNGNQSASLVQAETQSTMVIRNMDDLSRLSKMLADSKFFDDAKDAAQAGVKVLAGIELGFPAIASMAGIHIIKGKASIGANLMAAAIKRSGKYNYRVLKLDDKVCEIVFFEGKEEAGRSKFTAEDAKRAGTQNMGKFPRNMLFARAMSNGVKWFCPDVFLAPVYTPDELGMAVDEDGNAALPQQPPQQPETQPKTIEATIEPPTSQLPPAQLNPIPSAQERLRAICAAMSIGGDQVERIMAAALDRAGLKGDPVSFTNRDVARWVNNLLLQYGINEGLCFDSENRADAVKQALVTFRGDRKGFAETQLAREWAEWVQEVTAEPEPEATVIEAVTDEEEETERILREEASIEDIY